MADVIPLLSTGASAQRVDIVFVAEGYQASERDKFITDANAFVDAMLGTSNAALNSPFSNYRSYFNASALFVASAQSGMDLNSGTQVNTAFGGGQRNGDGRLVYGDSAAVNVAVAQSFATNAHEMTVVLVNSTIYGGSGGQVVWATTGNRSSSEILLHEIGHSFASLEDEYVDTATAPLYPVTGLSSVHLTSNQSVLPWSAWLGFRDSLGTVGVYEGGYYRSTGIWRATFDSKMNHLGTAFSAPEKEAFVLAYYATIGDYLQLSQPLPGIARATVPDASLLSFGWTISGGAARADTTYLDLRGQGAYVSGASATLVTRDATGLVRTGLANTQQSESLAVGTPLAETVVTTAALAITGSGGLYQFTALNNSITAAAAAQSNYVDGGAGTDTFSLAAASASYTLRPLSTGTLLLETGGTPTWALAHIERLQFADRKLAFDMDGAAGNTAKLIGAVFGKTQLLPGYITTGLALFDGGASVAAVAELALSTSVFQQVWGARSNGNVVSALFQNVMGRAPTASEKSLYTGLIDNGTYTQASLAWAAAQTAENQAGINLVGLAATGLDYL